MAEKPIPHLMTVAQFAETHPAFSEGSLRWLIFRASAPDEHPNAKALADAIVRVGRKILIDEVKFFEAIGAL